ncbi:unnamed protein product [Aspergillus oryzae RIB40]|uniref:DNA, SC003 n=2 Tax=Aspergillus oryzae TaxID=5062 RepID=Q2UM05_ASPOR|nr:unnamed protein product [Aspergillus oryzae RIB40]BAE57410.1 unnamed protein product [Aspergillus oryzae RIB40]
MESAGPEPEKFTFQCGVSVFPAQFVILSQRLLSHSVCPVKMADRNSADIKPKCTPAELMLKVILTGTLSHYETRGMIDDKRLEHMLSAGKQILYKTHQESDVR